LVADFDIIDFLHVLTTRCVELLDVQAAGIILTDQRGALRVMASSSEQARLLELFELDTDEGPCLECYRTRQPVSDTRLGQPDPRWSGFGRRARAAGFESVYALPMRLRTDLIGVVNLLRAASCPLDDADTRVAQALADVATIGLLQQRAIEHRQVLAEQLQNALNSRVVIEQAKGILAERLHVGMQEAFDTLRRYARGSNRRLTDLAQQVIDEGIDTAELAGGVQLQPGREVRRPAPEH
jgi:hypothetical protein